MKKIIAALILILIVSMGCAINLKHEYVSPQADNFDGGGIGNVVRTNCQTSTSSPQYVVAGAASSTCIVDIRNVNAVALNYFAHSTTTNPTLSYGLFISNDDNSDNRNWYPVESGYATSLFSTSTEDTISFRPGNYKTFYISNLVGKYLKVEDTMLNSAAEKYLEITGREL